MLNNGRSAFRLLHLLHKLRVIKFSSYNFTIEKFANYGGKYGKNHVG